MTPYDREEPRDERDGAEARQAVGPREAPQDGGRRERPRGLDLTDRPQPMDRAERPPAKTTPRGDGPRPPRRRQRRGAASRERILETAGRMFASRGFNGVSTRELAQNAGVNLSAISYHFGGKQGLYREVWRRVIADTEDLGRQVVERFRPLVRAAAGDRVALAGLAAWFVAHIITAILGREDYRWQMALILREFHEPTDAFEAFLETRIHPLHDAVAELVAAATGRGAGDDETLLLTAGIIGQCMGFGFARTVVWARLGWDGYTPERVDEVITTVTGAVLGSLGLPRIDGIAVELELGTC